MPRAVAENSTALTDRPLTACARAAVYPSGLYSARESAAATRTRSAPCWPSFSASPAAAVPTRAAVSSAPKASATARPAVIVSKATLRRIPSRCSTNAITLISSLRLVWFS